MNKRSHSRSMVRSLSGGLLQFNVIFILTMENKQYVTHCPFYIGDIKADGFKTESGDYLMSQTGSAETIGEDESYARRFLRSKAFKDIWGKGFTPGTFEVLNPEQLKGQTRISGWPPVIVGLYWHSRGNKGNKRAFALTNGLIIDALEERIREAFGDTTTITERNEKLSEYVSLLEAENTDLRNNSECWQYINQELNQQLEDLSEGMTEPDHLEAENARLLRILREHGINPYSPQNYI
ncbi:MAG: hypothetical protein F6J98_44140 [Moorea sp. SIO4G2]|nr:hypothetical protein [Moorena sp. SIO4G2]